MLVKREAVNLTCTAINDVDAIQSLQVKWYKRNQLVIQDGVRIIVHNKSDKTSRQLTSSLSLHPVNPGDHGMYTFKALNHHDSYSESRINLIVQCMAQHIHIHAYSNYVAIAILQLFPYQMNHLTILMWVVWWHCTVFVQADLNLWCSGTTVIILQLLLFHHFISKYSLSQLSLHILQITLA